MTSTQQRLYFLTSSTMIFPLSQESLPENLLQCLFFQGFLVIFALVTLIRNSQKKRTMEIRSESTIKPLMTTMHSIYWESSANISCTQMRRRLQAKKHQSIKRLMSWPILCMMSQQGRRTINHMRNKVVKHAAASRGYYSRPILARCTTMTINPEYVKQTPTQWLCAPSTFAQVVCGSIIKSYLNSQKNTKDMKMKRITFTYKSPSLFIDVIYIRKPAEKGNHMQEYANLGIFYNHLALFSLEIHIDAI